ncbi:MAG TPA: NlpC/P60 family protein [Bacteroidota bacterium]|nr:NlpC/P60 family protein [Bacteroidota bacterium]
MKRTDFLIFLFSWFLFLPGCSDLSRQNRRFTDAVDRINAQYAPDKKLAIFTVTVKRTNKGIALFGEVDDPAAKQALIAALSPLVKKITDDITVLPGADLGGRNRGIVSVGIADMRREPVDSSELLSQATMGSAVKLLKEESGWYYVQTADKYLGWMSGGSFTRCTKENADAWDHARKAIVVSTYASMRELPQAHSPAVCDLVAGSLVKSIGSVGAWTRVELPDGRKGFIPDLNLADFDSWEKNITPTPDGVERTARSLLGVPYLWGGTSTKAVDCSGFTKTVYRMNGVQLHRDAYQQAQEGVDVVPGEKFQNLRKGDLLFFGRKANGNRPCEILHVALYLKDRLFIHASGTVKINSLDPSSPIFDANKIRSFICARRIIPETPARPGIALHHE